MEIFKGNLGTFNPLAPNTHTDFTRRLPSLPQKQLARDAKITKAIVMAYDLHKDNEKVKEIFFKKAKFLSNPRYWEVMRTVWIAVGSTETAREFVAYMKSNRPCKGWFMTPEDAKTLDGMKFPIMVYRAFDNEPDLAYRGVLISRGLKHTQRQRDARLSPDWLRETTSSLMSRETGKRNHHTSS